MNNEQLLSLTIHASVEAGLEILKVYEKPIEVETKEDNSPLTAADKASHEAIKVFLDKTGIPVLSEEGKEIAFEERKNWNRLWIVDPLDGTKEFIKRNGEFTVNIALIENGFPVMGVIYVPVLNQLYFGWEKGAYFLSGKTPQELIELSKDIAALCKHCDSLPSVSYADGLTRIVASRSHNTPETDEFIQQTEKTRGKVELVSMGSSLKICLVAHGKADLYPRFAPTMEWDTAAGQAIAEASGKSFINYTTGKRMHYNRENLRNDWFLVS